MNFEINKIEIVNKQLEFSYVFTIWHLRDSKNKKYKWYHYRNDKGSIVGDNFPKEAVQTDWITGINIVEIDKTHKMIKEVIIGKILIPNYATSNPTIIKHQTKMNL